MSNENTESSHETIIAKPKFDTVEYIDCVLYHKRGSALSYANMLIFEAGVGIACYIMLRGRRFQGLSLFEQSVRNTVESMLWIQPALNKDKVVISKLLPIRRSEIEISIGRGIQMATDNLFQEGESETLDDPEKYKERGHIIGSNAIYLCLRSENWEETFDKIFDAAREALVLMERIEEDMLKNSYGESFSYDYSFLSDAKYIYEHYEKYHPFRPAWADGYYSTI